MPISSSNQHRNPRFVSRSSSALNFSTYSRAYQDSQLKPLSLVIRRGSASFACTRRNWEWWILRHPTTWHIFSPHHLAHLRPEELQSQAVSDAPVSIGTTFVDTGTATARHPCNRWFGSGGTRC